MTKKSIIVAINIVYKNEIMNKDGVPIIFIWNKENNESFINILKTLKNNKEFESFLMNSDILKDINKFDNSYIAYSLIDNDNTYDYGIMKINDLYHIEECNTIIKHIADLSIADICKISLEYEPNLDDIDYKTIYKSIIAKYNVSDLTFLNYIRYYIYKNNINIDSNIIVDYIKEQIFTQN